MRGHKTLSRTLNTPIGKPKFEIRTKSERVGRGVGLNEKEKHELVASIASLFATGITSSQQIAKKTGYSIGTIDKYRTYASDTLTQLTPQRESIRALEQQRCYWMLEQLSSKLKTGRGKNSQTPEQFLKITDSMLKWSTHLSHLSGLMAETNVHVDPTKLVIIRSGSTIPEPPKVVEAEEAQTVGGISIVRSDGDTEDDTSSEDEAGEDK